MTKHIRVLAIDGGGVRGIIPATLLEQLSSNAGKQVPELFDFVIGTSIGGILAAAYASPSKINATDPAQVKFTPSQVVDLLKDNAARIFPPDKAVKGVRALDHPKYPREGLDSLLESNFKIADTNLKLIDTLIPVGITSQNAVADEAHVWFSCSETYSRYALKDVTGASSAAPTYFAPKFISVLNNTQAHANDCSQYKLVEKDGVCQDKNLDGGLFANSPALLSLFAMNKISLGKVVSECNKYSIFNDLSKLNNFNLTLEFASQNPYSPPHLTIGNDIDVTVVSLGTGYFIENNDIPNEASTVDRLGTYSLVGGILGAIGVVASIGTPCYILNRNSVDTEKGPYIALTSCCSCLFFSTITGLAFTSYAFLNTVTLATDGYVGVLKNGLINSILDANEATDLAVSRDIFGTIAINPIFKGLSSIPLDASDESDLNLMRLSTVRYFTDNRKAFDELTRCLQNTNERIQDCDEASKYFYDNFRDEAGDSIITFSQEKLDNIFEGFL